VVWRPGVWVELKLRLWLRVADGCDGGVEYGMDPDECECERDRDGGAEVCTRDPDDPHDPSDIAPPPATRSRSRSLACSLSSFPGVDDGGEGDGGMNDRPIDPDGGDPLRGVPRTLGGGGGLDVGAGFCGGSALRILRVGVGESDKSGLLLGSRSRGAAYVLYAIVMGGG